MNFIDIAAARSAAFYSRSKAMCWWKLILSRAADGTLHIVGAVALIEVSNGSRTNVEFSAKLARGS
jgi:hypothetical protein